MQLQDWRRQGEFIAYRGHDIFLRRAGQAGAPPLLLIHGFPTASWDWHRIWPSLTERYQLIAPDMIGFGFSDKPRRYPYAISDQADLCAHVLDHCGTEKVHVLAHDYGDTVAQELLARHLDGQAPRLASLCLLNGGLFPETHHARLIQKLLHTPLGPLITQFTGQQAFNRSLAAVFGADTQPSDRELADFWTLASAQDGVKIFHRLIRYMAERRQHRSRWVGALQQADIPIRLINGPDDPVSGAHMVQRYRELIPRPDVVSLPGIGHYPQVEDPAGVLDAYLAFRNSLNPTGA